MIPTKLLKKSIFGVLATLGFVLGPSLFFGIPVHAAWTEPGSTPPGGNVAAPLNVSGTPQTKQGQLTVQASQGSVFSLQGFAPTLGDSATNTTVAGIWGTGVKSTDSNTTAAVYGIAYQLGGSTGQEIGLLGVAGSSSGNSYGVYGWDNTNAAAFAGYFRGHVGVEGDVDITANPDGNGSGQLSAVKLCFPKGDGTSDCRGSWSDVAGLSFFAYDQAPNTIRPSQPSENNESKDYTGSNFAIGGTNSTNSAFFFNVAQNRGTLNASDSVVIGPPPGTPPDDYVRGDKVCSKNEPCDSSDCYGQVATLCEGTGKVCAHDGGNSCVDVLPPSAPSGLSTNEAPSYNVVHLKWNPSTDTGGSGLKEYWVYRCDATETSCTPYSADNANQNKAGTVTAFTSLTTVTFDDASVNASTTYSYQVVAVDNSNNTSAASNTLNVTTTAPPPAAPTVTLLAAPEIIDQGAQSTLSWTSDHAETLSIDQGINGVASPSGSMSVTPQLTTTYTITAIGAGGTSTATATVTVRPPDIAPTVPTGLDSQVWDNNSITLVWAKSTDTDTTGVAGYEIYRCTGDPCTINDNLSFRTGVVNGDPASPSFRNTGLSPCTIYTYEVKAFDSASPDHHYTELSAPLAIQTNGKACGGGPNPIGFQTSPVKTLASAQQGAGQSSAIRPLARLLSFGKKTFQPFLGSAVYAAANGGSVNAASIDPATVRLSVYQGIVKIVSPSGVTAEIGQELQADGHTGSIFASDNDIFLKPKNSATQNQTARFSNDGGAVDLSLAGAVDASRYCITTGTTKNCISDWTDAGNGNGGTLTDVNAELPLTVDKAIPTAPVIKLNYPLDIVYGGTGADSAAAARANLVAAKSGDNSDITSLTGLTTALPVTEGGTGTSEVLASGAVVFAGNGGVYTQDGENFSYDTIHNRLGIGTNTPDTTLDINGQIKIRGGNPGEKKVLTSDANGVGSWSSVIDVGGVTGSGTVNRLPKWGTSTNLADSMVFDNGTTVGISNDTPNASYKLDVAGKINTANNFCINGDCVNSWSNLIRNQTTSQSGANFNIDGSGRIGTTLTVDTLINLPASQRITLPNSIDQGGTLNGKSYTSRYVFGSDGVSPNEYFGIASSNNTANPVLAISDDRNVHLGSTGSGNATSLCFYGTGSAECVNKKSDFGGLFSGAIQTGQVAYGTGTNAIGGSNSLFWDTTNNRLNLAGTIAASGGAVGTVTNLLSKSEQLEVTPVWSSNSANITADATNAPNGTKTAETINHADSGLNGDRFQSITPGGTMGGRTFTFSIWLKTNSAHTARLQIRTAANSQTPVPVAVTTSWQRFSDTYTIPAGDTKTAVTADVYITDGISYVSSIDAWGAQLEESTYAGPYLATDAVPASTSGVIANGIVNLGTLSADPSSGANGQMYYNTATDKFRCYQNWSWTDCLSSSTGTITSINEGPGIQVTYPTGPAVTVATRVNATGGLSNTLGTDSNELGINFGANNTWSGTNAYTNASGITLGEDKAPGTQNAAGQFKLMSGGDNAFSTIFKTGTQTADASYTLPLNVAAGLLRSDGSGTLSWDTSVLGSGTITAVGDCTIGNCFTGTSGTNLTFKGTGTGTTILSTKNTSATPYTISLPAANGTAAVSAASPLALDANTGALTLGTVGIGQGGTGNTSYTANQFLAYNSGTGKIQSSGYDNTSFLSTALSSGKIFIGNVSGQAAQQTVSGDATLANNGALTLQTVNGNIGSYGSGTSIPNFTVNGKGLLTAAGQTDISGKLPPAAGNTGNTLRDNGTNWISANNLYNSGSNIGIGSTAPVGKLVVDATAGNNTGSGNTISAYASSANSALYAQQTGTGYAGYFSSNLAVANANGAFLGTIGAYQNLALQSEAVDDNTAWRLAGGGSLSFQHDAEIGPDGGAKTADEISISGGAGNGRVQDFAAMQASTNYTLSVWARTTSGNQTFQLWANNGNTTSKSPVLTATTSWQRLSWTFPSQTVSGSTPYVGIGNNSNTTPTTFRMWGFQLEQSSAAGPYVRTTTNVVPANQGVVSNGTPVGTVSSVGLSAPNIFSVSGSPVTTSGTLGLSLVNQNQNLIFASPSGSSGMPSFRTAVKADLPSAIAYEDEANSFSQLQTFVGGIASTEKGNTASDYALYLKRNTDTGPLGNLIQAQNAAGAMNLFAVDANGLITTPSVNSASIVDGSVANADLANSSLTVSAGTGLTDGGSVPLGGTTTLNVGAGNGIAVNNDTVGVNLDTTNNITATNSSGSGLEFDQGNGYRLSLIRGCNTGQVLKWSQGSKIWGCADDQQGTTGNGYNQIQDEGANVTQSTILNFTGNGVACDGDATKTTCTIPGGAGVGGSGTATQVAFFNGQPGNSSTTLASSSNLFWDRTNNRLGIGVSSPFAPLHIQGAGLKVGTGNVTNLANNTTVTGDATVFQTELHVGDSIAIELETRIIASIISQNSLTVDSNFLTVHSTAVQFTYQSAVSDVATSNGTVQSVVNALGNVGIGQNGSGAKLAVNNPTTLLKVGSANDAIYAYANGPNGAAISAEQQGGGYAGYFSGRVAVTSDIRVLENGNSPQYYGIFDVTDLSGSQTYTFPDSGGNVVIDTATQTLTNKTIGSTLTFSNVATDITTGANEDLTITPNGTGAVVLSKARINNLAISNLTTNGPIYTSGGNGTLNSEAQLAVTRGGTGTGTYTKGDMLYSDNPNSLAKLGIGNANQILTVSGSNTPQWSTTIPASALSLTNGNIFVGNASDVAVGVVPSGDASMTNAGAVTVTGLQGKPVDATAPTSDQVLQWKGTKWVPSTISTGTGNIAKVGDCSAGECFTGAAGSSGSQLVFKGATNNTTLGFTPPSAPQTVTLPDATGTVALGTGTAGQVAYWNGSNTTTSDSNFVWDNANKRLGIGAANPTSRLQVQNTAAQNGTGQISGNFPEANISGTGTKFLSELKNGYSIIVGAQSRTVMSVTDNLNLTVNYPFDNPRIDDPIKVDFQYQQPTALFNSSAGDVLMNVNAMGKVGIGTPAEDGKVVVNNTSNAYYGGVNDALDVYNNGAGSAIYAQQESTASKSYAGYFSGMRAGYFVAPNTLPDLNTNNKVVEVRNNASYDTTSSPLTNYGLYVANNGAAGVGGNTLTNVGLFVNVPAGTGVTNYGLLVQNGNVGIGNTTPASLLTVGNGGQFQVDASGNINTTGNETIAGTLSVAALNGIVHATSGLFSTGNVNLATEVTGTLPLANLTDNNTTAGIPLVSGGSSNPNYAALNLAQSTAIINSLPLANLTNGTSGAPLLGGSTIPAYGQLDLSNSSAVKNRLLLANFATGASGVPLLGNGTNSPAYGALNLAGGPNVITGLLPVNNGGTGMDLSGNTNQGGVLYKTSSGIAVVPTGTATNCLVSNGTGAPSWGSCGSTSQWTNSGNNIYNVNAGNVSVGTGALSPTPTSRLQVDSGDIAFTYGANYGSTGRNSGKIGVMDRLRGRQINSNPDFLEGQSGYNVYDLGGSGSITLSVISNDTAPNASSRILQIAHNSNNNPSPGLGGFTNNFPKCSDGNVSVGQCYHVGDRIVYSMWAKIPAGYTINFATNDFGNNGNTQWISSTDGTGNWEEYVMEQTIGVGGTFDNTGYYYITATTGVRVFTWYVASLNIVDVDQPSDTDRASQMNIGYKTDVDLGKGNLLTTSSAYLATDSGNVGIGQLSPGAKLAVNNPTTPLKYGSSTDALYSFAQGGTAISAEQGDSGSYAVYASGGKNYFSGNVGIGTTNPDGLQVGASLSETARGEDNVRFGVLSGKPRAIFEDSGAIQWEMMNSAGMLNVLMPGKDALAIDDDGNLGLGSFNIISRPQASLDISPSVTPGSNGANAGLKVTPLYSGNLASAQSVYYGVNNTPTFNLSGAGSNTISTIYNTFSGLTLNAGTVGTWYGAYVDTPTGAGTITNKYALVTEAGAGNVGIGNQAPTSPLTVYSDSTPYSGSTNSISAYNSSTAAVNAVAGYKSGTNVAGSGVYGQISDNTSCSSNCAAIYGSVGSGVTGNAYAGYFTSNTQNNATLYAEQVNHQGLAADFNGKVLVRDITNNVAYTNTSGVWNWSSVATLDDNTISNEERHKVSSIYHLDSKLSVLGIKIEGTVDDEGSCSAAIARDSGSFASGNTNNTGYISVATGRGVSFNFSSGKPKLFHGNLIFPSSTDPLAQGDFCGYNVPGTLNSAEWVFDQTKSGIDAGGYMCQPTPNQNLNNASVKGAGIVVIPPGGYLQMRADYAGSGSIHCTVSVIYGSWPAWY